jgi:hypothetical protein
VTPEFGVHSTPRKQLGMRAIFGYFAFVEQDNPDSNEYHNKDKSLNRLL